MKFKKLTAVILAGVMVCAMGMSALAAGSPSAQVEGTGTDASGNSVELLVSESSEPAPETATIQSLVSDYVDTMKVASVQDVSVKGDKSLISWPVTIVFSYSGVNANTKVAVLHWNGSAWENVGATAGENTITATFQSLSPVAIIVDTATMTQTSTSQNQTQTGGNTVKSPNTGESQVVFVLGIVALVAVCGAFGLSRSSKKRA